MCVDEQQLIPKHLYSKVVLMSDSGAAIPAIGSYEVPSSNIELPFLSLHLYCNFYILSTIIIFFELASLFGKNFGVNQEFGQHFHLKYCFYLNLQKLIPRGVKK
ncbi:hypothetical protein CDAR_59591 [Caerostris darwini]|uniref:Uncharacterized protein n=1 Tax=Caerostris darwini TaxID=1538125 RepID=A0AAV4X566_9ARAC|nr:hypothetical protein CDAR_59591 [Caerostris darwini]